MEYKDIKGKSVDELKAQIAELKKELFNLRFQKASGELTNTTRFKAVRREIAQIMTYVNSTKAA